MSNPQTYSSHVRKLLALGLPLIGSNLAQVAIGLTDVAMLGWYSIEAQAAQTVAGSFFFTVYLVGAGFAFGVMPMVASHAEEGEIQELRRVTRMGLWISIVFGLLFLPALLNGEWVLGFLGQEEEILPLIGDYSRIMGWAIFPGLILMVLRSYLSALERTQVLFWVTIGAVTLNAVLNWVLIFGNFGAPELGIAGAAIASFTMQAVSVVALVVFIRIKEPEHKLFTRLWRVDLSALVRVFRLGLPICMTNLAEVSLFAGSAVLMGWIGTLPLAAHGIALQLASLTFVVHLGLSNAATVRAGRAVGRHDAEGLRRGAHVATALSLVMSAITIVVFVVIPDILTGAFVGPEVEDRDLVIEIASGLLLMAAMFQTFDGLQVIGLGLLRGFQDAKWPMVYAALGYWVIGMPASYILGFRLGFEGQGVWGGLVIGLAVVSALLLWRFWAIVKRDWS